MGSPCPPRHAAAPDVIVQPAGRAGHLGLCCPEEGKGRRSQSWKSSACARPTSSTPRTRSSARRPRPGSGSISSPRYLLDGAAELPPLVGGKVVVRRNADVIAVRLRRLEELLDVLDRIVLAHALPDESPRDALRAQEVVLGIGDDERRVFRFDVHAFPPWLDARGTNTRGRGSVCEPQHGRQRAPVAAGRRPPASAPAVQTGPSG